MEKELNDLHKMAALLEEIEICTKKMQKMAADDLGVCILQKSTKNEIIDFRMDKTLFDMYWNIREKAYKKLEELAKQK